jgi:hypothetical protein
LRIVHFLLGIARFFWNAITLENFESRFHGSHVMLALGQQTKGE